MGKYNLHEEYLVVAEDIEDLVQKLGCDWEVLGMKSYQHCVSGHNAKVSEKRGWEVAGLLVEVDTWFDEVDRVEAAKVETVAGNLTRQRHSCKCELGVVDAAGRKRNVRIDWT